MKKECYKALGVPQRYKAIEKGYRLIQIHEVRDFLQCRKGLFQLYVDTWLKIKQESGGYPNWVRTNMQKGIWLDPTKIAENPRRKATAKFMRNSFWLKFGQQNNNNS